MVWFRRRRRYDPYDPYDPYYGGPRRGSYGYRGAPYGYRRGPMGGSCLRDACLLDAGCCIAESLDGNCLVLTMLTVPQLVAELRRHGRGSGGGAARMIVGGIRVYQREISARRPGCCRFSPTCSEYAVRAVQVHGARRGLALTVRRLLRCRPGGRRGSDPAPVLHR